MRFRESVEKPDYGDSAAQGTRHEYWGRQARAGQTLSGGAVLVVIRRQDALVIHGAVKDAGDIHHIFGEAKKIK